MTKPILFSLENCVKCMQTKEFLSETDDIEVVTFPHDLNAWSQDEVTLAKTHDVFEDLQKTAPILWRDGEKMVGYLRIRKWLQDNR